jgi:hypothetical protein
LLGSTSFRLISQRSSARSIGSTSTSALYTSAQARFSTRKTFERLNYNSDVLFDDSTVDHVNCEIVTANDLESHTAPPKCVKMLVRDFIEDSLYNPNYGYFPHKATILSPSDNNIDFRSLRDSVEFQIEVAKQYAAYGADREAGFDMQLWHTPTELFKVNSSFSRSCVYI